MGVIAMLALGAVGCTQAEPPAEPVPETESELPAEASVAASADETTAVRALPGWEGLWNSADTYFDNPGFVVAYETLAGLPGAVAS